MAETLGDWTLKFTVDSKGLSEATSGVQNLESSMQEAAHKSNGLAKELKGIKSDVSGLGKNFMLLGAAAGGALGGLAAMAPSLAGEFADMKIAMMGLGDALAPHIKPILDGITNSLIGLAQWVNENPEAAGWMVNIIAAVGALGAASLVFKMGEGIYDLFSAGLKLASGDYKILDSLKTFGLKLADGVKSLISGGISLASTAATYIKNGLSFAAGALIALKDTIIGAFTGSAIGQGLAAAVGSAAGGTGILGGLSALGVGATGGAVGAGGTAAAIGGAIAATPVIVGAVGQYLYGEYAPEKMKEEVGDLGPLGFLGKELFGGNQKENRKVPEIMGTTPMQTSYSHQATTELGMSGREKQNQIIIQVLGSLVTENELLDKVSEGLQRIGVQYG